MANKKPNVSPAMQAKLKSPAAQPEAVVRVRAKALVAEDPSLTRADLSAALLEEMSVARPFLDRLVEELIPVRTPALDAVLAEVSEGESHSREVSGAETLALAKYEGLLREHEWDFEEVYEAGEMDYIQHSAVAEHLAKLSQQGPTYQCLFDRYSNRAKVERLLTNFLSQYPDKSDPGLWRKLAAKHLLEVPGEVVEEVILEMTEALRPTVEEIVEEHEAEAAVLTPVQQAKIAVKKAKEDFRLAKIAAKAKSGEESLFSPGLRWFTKMSVMLITVAFWVGMLAAVGVRSAGFWASCFIASVVGHSVYFMGYWAGYWALALATVTFATSLAACRLWGPPGSDKAVASSEELDVRYKEAGFPKGE